MRSHTPLVRSAVAAVVVLLLAYIAYVLEQPIPLLDWFDLAIHESGHLLAFPLPEIGMFLAGSVLQVAVPLGLAWYFWMSQRDRAAVAFCLGWAGTSARDVAVYAADARAQALPLIGGGEHDWNFILGHFGALERTESIAGFIAALGMLMLGAAFVVALTGLVGSPRRVRSLGSGAVPSGIRHRSPRHVVQNTFSDGDPWSDVGR